MTAVIECLPNPQFPAARVFAVAGPLTLQDAMRAHGIPRLWSMPGPGEPCAGMICQQIDVTHGPGGAWLVTCRYIAAESRLPGITGVYSETLEGFVPLGRSVKDSPVESPRVTT